MSTHKITNVKKLELNDPHKNNFTTMNVNLFSTFIKIIDFEPDIDFNRELLKIAQKKPELNDSTSHCNLLLEQSELIHKLRKKFNIGLSAYLRDIKFSEENSCEVDAYAFFNYTQKSAFTPYHNHVGDADLVAIYYACIPQSLEETPSASYYNLPDGLLVLHDPRCDTIDRRGTETRDHYLVYPRENRMILQPATIAHSVTPNNNQERLAVTCNFIINKNNRWKNYQTYFLDMYPT